MFQYVEFGFFMQICSAGVILTPSKGTSRVKLLIEMIVKIMHCSLILAHIIHIWIMVNKRIKVRIDFKRSIRVNMIIYDYIFSLGKRGSMMDKVLTLLYY